MTWTIQSTDLRRRVREVLDRVRLQREPAIICSYDTPQAVIIPYEDFEEFKQWQMDRKQRAVWLAELQRIAEDVSARAALSEDEANALAEEAARATRAK
jgi:prevent-host-death family protein